MSQGGTVLGHVVVGLRHVNDRFLIERESIPVQAPIPAVNLQSTGRGSARDWAFRIKAQSTELVYLNTPQSECCRHASQPRHLPTQRWRNQTAQLNCGWDFPCFIREKDFDALQRHTKISDKPELKINEGEAAEWLSGYCS